MSAEKHELTSVLIDVDVYVNVKRHWYPKLAFCQRHSGQQVCPDALYLAALVISNRIFSTTMATTFTISDLAKEFDLTTRAMRFYEDMGLLQPQRAGPGGRSRVYSARDRTRLKLTLRAKRLGLSLVEAKEIIDSYDNPRDTAPQLRIFLSVLAEHRQKLEAQMLDLQANLEEIRSHEKESRALLRKCEKQHSSAD